MDFESLSAALIREYNLCFTTVDWAGGDGGGRGRDSPPLPADGRDRGVLPRVVESLVVTRRNLKELMNGEVDPDKREQASFDLFEIFVS